MKRTLKLTACLLLAVLCLTACSGPKETFEEYATITQAVIPADTPKPVEEEAEDSSSVGLMDQNPYDFADEEFNEDEILQEEGYDPEPLPTPEPVAAVADSSTFYYDYTSDATIYPYAGATPIPLDPVDKPTPTPRPELNFTYEDTISNALGLTFQMPIGWTMDESQPQLCILTEPSYTVMDGQQATITISAEPVANKYTTANLKTFVSQRLSTLGSADNVTSFSTMNAATRKMLGATGVYNNYTATLSDGTRVGGRILYVYVEKNKTLYGMEIVYPKGFQNAYETMFNNIRNSMKIK